MKKHSGAAWSVLIFGLYMGAEGLLLMAAPDVLLGALRLPLAADVWPRVVGLSLVVLGTYYIFAFWREDCGFFRLSSFVRMVQFLFFVWLFARGLIVPVLVASAAVELFSGALTLWLLQGSTSRPETA